MRAGLPAIAVVDPPSLSLASQLPQGPRRALDLRVLHLRVDQNANLYPIKNNIPARQGRNTASEIFPVRWLPI